MNEKNGFDSVKSFFEFLQIGKQWKPVQVSLFSQFGLCPISQICLLVILPKPHLNGIEDTGCAVFPSAFF